MPAVISGILNLDKPDRVSSAGALTRIKLLFPKPQRPKIGHAGTLDPFATGVLLVLLGSATKRCEELMGQPKRYRATIKLGATTPTLDPTSDEIPAATTPAISLTDVHAVLPRFTGTIEQLPPAFSALRIGGRRSYELARTGQEVPLKARPITIYALDLIRYDWPLLEIDVNCGKGTYIRSLARDIAEALGTTGYLTQLRRTAIGPFTADAAIPLSAVTAENLQSLLSD